MATNPSFTGTLGVSMDNTLCKRTVLNRSPWNPIPGSGNNFLAVKITASNFIAVMKDKTVSVATDILGPWTPVAQSGSVICVTDVPVNSFGFAPGSWLGVGTDNNLYTRPGPEGIWTPVPNSGSVICIAFGWNGYLLALGTDNKLYRFTGTMAAPSWAQIPEVPASAANKWICFGGTTGQSLYGVGTDNSVWNGNGDINNVMWSNIPSSNAVISVDMSGVGGG